MHVNKFIRQQTVWADYTNDKLMRQYPVGADVSRPPPIYRPRANPPAYPDVFVNVPIERRGRFIAPTADLSAKEASPHIQVNLLKLIIGSGATHRTN